MKRVEGEFEGEWYPGTVIKEYAASSKVRFDDGEVHNMPRKRLRNLAHVRRPKPRKTPRKGAFVTRAVKWDSGRTPVNFSVDAADEGLHFYGGVRKTRLTGTSTEAWAVDIWAKGNGENYSMDAIPYTEGDPRENMVSLESDICAVIEKWLYMYHSNVDGYASVADIRRRANTPEIKFTTLAHFDRMMMALNDLRSTGLHSGGERRVQIHSDREGDPVVTVCINFTAQAIGLEGKVPSIYDGAAFDDPQRRGNKGQVHVTNPENVEALAKALERTTDDKERKKIRAAMRRMGHRGGKRALAKKGKK